MHSQPAAAGDATGAVGATLPGRLPDGLCRRHARRLRPCVLGRGHRGTCLPNPYFYVVGGRRG